MLHQQMLNQIRAAFVLKLRISLMNLMDLAMCPDRLLKQAAMAYVLNYSF